MILSWYRKITLLAVSIFTVTAYTVPSNGLAVNQSASSSTYNFQSADDFTISDSEKLQFSGSSVKIIPTGAVSDGFQAFYDSEWGESATVWVMGIETDSDGNIYVAGNVNPNYAADSTDFHAFIEKLDPNFNVIWNKKYLLSPGWANTTKGGFNDINISPSDGFIYGLALVATVSGGVASEANVSLLKIDPSDGDLIWQESRQKTIYAGITPWTDAWDEGTGPQFDSLGNIYFSYSDGCARNIGSTGMSGPLVIAKYDTSGNELWAVSDDLVGPGERPTCTRIYPAYEDSWEMVVDSENSVYIASSYWGPTTANMNYIVTKYNSDGTLGWKNMRDYGDIATGGWDSPRSLSIDSNDYIYVNGNPPVNSTQSCLLRKLDKSGNVMIDYQDLNPTGTRNDFAYCWGATIDQFDRWISIGSNGTKYTLAYYGQSGESAVELETMINYNLTGMTGTQASHKTTVDKYGNVYGYSAQVTNDGGFKQYVIFKAENTYPDTSTETGTPVTLVNKTGMEYEYLTGFAIDYGEADQNDVGFQISNNGTDWYWWNGTTWVKTTGNDNNDVATINSNISAFSTQLGRGIFYFKTFMLTDGTKQVDLASVTVTEGPIPTPTPSATSSATTSSIEVLPETGADKYLFWAMGLI